MPSFNINSFNLKIFISFVLLALFLLTILLFQIIPAMEDKEAKYIKNHIENVIYVTNQQIILAEKAIKNDGLRKRDELKSLMEREVNRIFSNFRHKDMVDINSKKYSFHSKKITCNTTVLDNDQNVLSQSTKENFQNLKNKLIFDDFLRYDETKDNVCSSGIRRLFYSKKLTEKNRTLVVSCNIDKFPSLGRGLEENIKSNIQTSFSLLDSFHKGKTYLMWLNTKTTNNDIPIYDTNDIPDNNNKYCLSHLSRFITPKTGLLSGNDLRAAINKEPIHHMMDRKEDKGNFIYPALTWVRLISEIENEKFLYITTVYEKDYKQQIASPLLKILPSVLISLFIAIFLGLFLFKRLSQTINTLTNTATQVIKGKLNKRNNITGSDDIAVLAQAFDKMLDFLEKNIESLDRKVESKTKLLTDSLNEKETLLKEIHHRVKNNLAITINLIKLEKSKIQNEETKDSLTNIQERVFVMELLHRKLYESKDLNCISVKKYIEELTNDLNRSYSNNTNIKIITVIEEKYINIDYALPTGLIITELVTNAFKYAFKNDNDHKMIKIIYKIEDEMCKIVVLDNGIGLSDSIDINNSESLGLQIVSSIINSQLFGTFRYIYENGSKFEIDFKVNEEVD